MATTQQADVDKAQGVLGEIFRPFIEARPLAVIARGLLERLLSGQWLDKMFEGMAESQYTRRILFSALVGLMLRVVLRTSTSVRAAYKMEAIGASLTAVYEKLRGIEPQVCAALVRDSSIQVEELCDALGARRPPLVEGRRVRILDGNAIEKSHHRIKELRELAAGPLPGKALVVYDPAIDTMLHMIPCEDGHAQERSMLDRIVPIVDRDELWIADRNFCVFSFLQGIAQANATFLIRHHKQLSLRAVNEEGQPEQVEGGLVSEQMVAVCDDAGHTLNLRCVRVYLDRATRDGDKILVLLTNLPNEEICARRLAELYRERWSIETAFQKLERDLNSEINSLGYPRAALFGLAVAMVAYNAMAAVQGTLRAAHGTTFVDEELSHYELAAEIEGPYEGMIVAIPEEHWQVFADLELRAFAILLVTVARCANTERLRKAKYTRRTTRPTKRRYDPAHPHVSIARIIANRKKPTA